MNHVKSSGIIIFTWHKDRSCKHRGGGWIRNGIFEIAVKFSTLTLFRKSPTWKIHVRHVKGFSNTRIVKVIIYIRSQFPLDSMDMVQLFSRIFETFDTIPIQWRKSPTRQRWRQSTLSLQVSFVARLLSNSARLSWRGRRSSRTELGALHCYSSTPMIPDDGLCQFGQQRWPRKKLALSGSV